MALYIPMVASCTVGDPLLHAWVEGLCLITSPLIINQLLHSKCNQILKDVQADKLTSMREKLLQSCTTTDNLPSSCSWRLHYFSYSVLQKVLICINTHKNTSNCTLSDIFGVALVLSTFITSWFLQKFKMNDTLTWHIRVHSHTTLTPYTSIHTSIYPV